MAEGGQSQVTEILTLPRKTKHKLRKKQKRKLFRLQHALQEIEEEEAQLNDPEEQARIRLKEQEEAALLEKQRREHEEREKAWLEAAARRKAEEEEQNRIIEESRNNELREKGEDDDVEYVEDGPAEIIWQGNEIIVRKRKVKITEDKTNQLTGTEVDDRPTSNPFPPQSEAVAAYNHITSDQLLEVFSQQTTKFGTEQDKAHCPFHLKTGACRFGSRCSRVHFYPDKSCTLLIKNMYSGPGLVWEQDEGLEHTYEEVERGYEEFYEDVHTEFLKYGEIVNFKVCRNGSSHLRGNVYVHYKFLDSAIFAYNSTNGRYFAGKQISCEYVGVSRWKIAICGEYMKSRSKRSLQEMEKHTIGGNMERVVLIKYILKKIGKEQAIQAKNHTQEWKIHLKIASSMTDVIMTIIILEVKRDTGRVILVKNHLEKVEQVIQAQGPTIYMKRMSWMMFVIMGTIILLGRRNGKGEFQMRNCVKVVREEEVVQAKDHNQGCPAHLKIPDCVIFQILMFLTKIGQAIGKAGFLVMMLAEITFVGIMKKRQGILLIEEMVAMTLTPAKGLMGENKNIDTGAPEGLLTPHIMLHFVKSMTKMVAKSVYQAKNVP